MGNSVLTEEKVLDWVYDAIRKKYDNHFLGDYPTQEGVRIWNGPGENWSDYVVLAEDMDWHRTDTCRFGFKGFALRAEHGQVAVVIKGQVITKDWLTEVRHGVIANFLPAEVTPRNWQNKLSELPLRSYLWPEYWQIEDVSMPFQLMLITDRNFQYRLCFRRFEPHQGAMSVIYRPLPVELTTGTQEVEAQAVRHWSGAALVTDRPEKVKVPSGYRSSAVEFVVQEFHKWWEGRHG